MIKGLNKMGHWELEENRLRAERVVARDELNEAEKKLYAANYHADEMAVQLGRRGNLRIFMAVVPASLKEIGRRIDAALAPASLGKLHPSHQQTLRAAGTEVAAALQDIAEAENRVEDSRGALERSQSQYDQVAQSKPVYSMAQAKKLAGDLEGARATCDRFSQSMAELKIRATGASEELGRMQAALAEATADSLVEGGALSEASETIYEQIVAQERLIGQLDTSVTVLTDRLEGAAAERDGIQAEHEAAVLHLLQADLNVLEERLCAHFSGGELENLYASWRKCHEDISRRSGSRLEARLLAMEVKLPTQMRYSVGANRPATLSFGS